MNRTISIPYPTNCKYKLCNKLLHDWEDNQIIDLLDEERVDVYCNSDCFDKAYHYPCKVLIIDLEQFRKILVDTENDLKLSDPIISDEEATNIKDIITLMFEVTNLVLEDKNHGNI